MLPRNRPKTTKTIPVSTPSTESIKDSTRRLNHASLQPEHGPSNPSRLAEACGLISRVTAASPRQRVSGADSWTGASESRRQRRVLTLSVPLLTFFLQVSKELVRGSSPLILPQESCGCDWHALLMLSMNHSSGKGERLYI